MVVAVAGLLSASAAPFPATVSGVVRDARGTPQMGAMVEVLGTAAHNLRVFTDENGFYHFDDLLAGLPLRIGDHRPGRTGQVHEEGLVGLRGRISVHHDGHRLGRLARGDSGVCVIADTRLSQSCRLHPLRSQIPEIFAQP